MSDSYKEALKLAYNIIKTQKPWSFEKSNIKHHRVLPYATLAPWMNDGDFLNVYEKIQGHTLVDIYRCYELWALAKQSVNVEGDILEVGVWRGGTGALLSQALTDTDKKVYLADTFSGVVKAGEKDTSYKGGEHADTSIEIVEELMRSFSTKNTTLLKGVFPEDTQHFIGGKISMLHCDVDVYDSTRDIVEWSLPRLSIGSIIVFDDYGFFGCEGVTIFCDEFKIRKDFHFLHNLNGHAVFIKIA